MNSSKFYDKFFKKDSFLTYKSSSVFTQNEYLSSIGFTPDLDLSDCVVLELGAGQGRLTFALKDMGIAQTAKTYIVVEPSRSISELEQNLDLPNAQFYNMPFEKLGDIIESGSIDYFIAQGVLPHVKTSNLSQLIGAIAPFISENGHLHIVSSYYGFSKRGSRILKRISSKFPIFIRPMTVLAAGLQLICCGGPAIAKSFYVKNFLYSHQRGVIAKLYQQLEYFSVADYNIHWGYQDYFSSLATAGFQVERILPHSIALVARKGGGGVSEFKQNLKIPLDAKIAIFGDDWSAKYVMRSLPQKNIRLVNRNSVIPDVEYIVIAYDYTDGPAYSGTVRMFGKKGYSLGENLFIFQMLLSG